jgi:hypothetical protein
MGKQTARIPGKTEWIAKAPDDNGLRLAYTVPNQQGCLAALQQFLGCKAWTGGPAAYERVIIEAVEGESTTGLKEERRLGERQGQIGSVWIPLVAHDSLVRSLRCCVSHRLKWIDDCATGLIAKGLKNGKPQLTGPQSEVAAPHRIRPCLVNERVAASKFPGNYPHNWRDPDPGVSPPCLRGGARRNSPLTPIT